MNLKNVYKMTNKINGRVYIGQTTRGMSERVHDHIKQARREDSPKYDLHKDIKKWGIGVYECELIDTATDIEQLKDKEEYWIQKHRDDGINLYNISGGRGVLGFKFSDECRAAMIASRKGLPPHHPGGETHPSAILNNNDIDKIEALIKEHLKVPEIALVLGVSESSVYQIINNNSWKSKEREFFKIEVMKKKTRYFNHKHEYELFLNHKGELVNEDYRYKFFKIVIHNDNLLETVKIKLSSKEWKDFREIGIGDRMDLPKQIILDYLLINFKEEGVKPNYFKIYT